MSSGGVSPLQKIPLGPGYQVPLAQAVKEATGVTTMAVGLITEAEQAEDIVASGKADMVALARGMLYDPRWGWHAAAELGGEVAAPPQYWRSQPSTQKALFGATTFGTQPLCPPGFVTARFMVRDARRCRSSRHCERSVGPARPRSCWIASSLRSSQ